MVYPLDKDAEYVEMSLSGDHRYLAVFSVKNVTYFVELIDADNWTSDGPVEVFPASEKMTYAWGDDESLAVTNHKGYVAVFTRTGVIYRGRIKSNIVDLDYDMSDSEIQAVKDLFDTASMKLGGDGALDQVIKPVRNENRCEW